MGCRTGLNRYGMERFGMSRWIGLGGMGEASRTGSRGDGMDCRIGGNRNGPVWNVA